MVLRLASSAAPLNWVVMFHDVMTFSHSQRFVIISSIPIIAIAAWGWAYHGTPLVVMLLPIGAIIGPIVGLFSNAPYFTLSFKLALLVGLAVSGLLIWAGIQRRSSWWGQLLTVLGFLAWSVCGLIGFGPQ